MTIRNVGILNGRILLVAVTFLTGAPTLAAETHDRWWPIQSLPKAIARTVNPQKVPEPRIAYQMMMQSVAGLAAKAVNDSHGNELVWIDNNGGDIENWYSRLLERHPDLKAAGVFEPWDLVQRYAKQGLIKGYILYRRENSSLGAKADPRKLDCSVNVATSLAGLLDGVIVDEELEDEAQAHGLTLLLDARDKTQAWCFETYKDQFNRRMLCTQDPRKIHSRDLAIAHKAFTVYGLDAPTPAAMEWLEPLSPILGWNEGDEFVITDLSTRYGHIQTATDWCLNLPVLMAGSEKLDLPKLKSFDPRTIVWSDSRSAVTFIGTDGDNVQWLEGNFFGGSTSYWGNPDRGKIPYGWSCCFAQLSQLCPQAIEFALETRKPNDTLIEWGGGYYFPDHFGSQRANGWDLLAQHAQHTWRLMQRTNSRIIGFNFAKIDSPEARKSCEVFAAQTDGLLAILAFQYAPYEGAGGTTFWVRDRNGIEVPVISGRYSIWEHANRERAGTPAKVAREIRQTVESTPPDSLPRYDWVLAHAWSYFKHAPGTDENAEDMPQEDWANGGIRGYSPVVWCAERLPASIRVVSAEELAWRKRMQHNPEQTKIAIQKRPQ